VEIKRKENNRKEGRRRKRDHEIFKYIPVGQGRNQPGGKSKCHFGGPNTKKEKESENNRCRPTLLPRAPCSRRGSIRRQQALKERSLYSLLFFLREQSIHVPGV
jgi:hypothetical protein